MMIIHYEVYVLESRGWMLHARFPRQERDGALAEAKELEQINLKVRVVRETYYTDTNAFDEADIYATGKGSLDKDKPKSAAAPSRLPAKAASSRGAAAVPRKAAANDRPRRPPERPDKSDVGMGRVVSRLLAITAVGLAAAILAVKATPNVIRTLWHMGLQLDISPEKYGTLLFTVFVLTFLMVAVPLALRFLPSEASITLKARQANQAAAAAAAAEAAARDRARKVKKSLNKLADKAVAEGFTADEAPPAEAPPPPDVLEMFEPELPEIRPDPEPDLPEIRPDPEQPPASEARPEPRPDPPAEPAVPQTGVAESNRSALMRFLGGSIDAVKRASAALDNYNKFALHLYLAGGVETLCDVRSLGQSDRRQLTGTALETLGTGGDLARKFHDKLPEYLMEPRYLQVIQAGRNAMEEFLAGREAAAHGELTQVIREWNRPAADKKKPSIVTVMFTDMVGSTDLTQAKGDAAAQEVVRRHNSIVRTALAQAGGREIKHTGDGIMASFPSAANAVEAAVVIQRNVAANNARMSDNELHLRIGLNAGEPIQEEDDLFGTTVQLAARVCAATDTDQILCTGVVKDLAFGKGATFHSAGEHALKGFRDKMTLFEVVWREG